VLRWYLLSHAFVKEAFVETRSAAEIGLQYIFGIPEISVFKMGVPE